MIHLLPVMPAKHRPLFEGWVGSERVRRWWGDPASRLNQFDHTPPNQHVLIASNEEPVGYIRWEVVDPQALAAVGLRGIPPGSVDMDLFVGEPDIAGPGAGPVALELVFERLRKRATVPLVGLCTSMDNIAAHRAFEKAGCIRWAQFNDDTFGLCWVYTRELLNATADGGTLHG